MAEINKAAKGVFWSAVERFSSQGCQLVLSIIIARLVDPADYGLLAMASVLLSIAEMIVDCGFTNALIQKKHKTDSDYSTVFWTNLIMGILVYTILFLCAPLISSFYNIDGIKDIVRVISCGIILYSLFIVQKTRFVIAINFKTQSAISLVAVLLSGFSGIIMAYYGFGVWALICQSVFFNIISLILYWYFSDWRPSFSFSLESFKSLFGFGSKLMITGIITTLYNNLYTIVIAKFFSPRDLGLYNRAESFAKQPMSSITMILARVIYPIECEWQDNNEELLKRYNQFLRLTAFAVIPLMFALAALAESVVKVLLTDKWNECVPLLQILCFVALFNPFIRLTWDIFNVKHRSDYSLINETINKSIAVLVLILTLPYGITVVCYGMIVYSLLNIIIMTYFTRKLVPGLDFTNFIRQIFSPLAMALIMFFIVKISILPITNDVLKLIVGILLGFCSYLLLAYIIKYRELKIINLYLIQCFKK